MKTINEVMHFLNKVEVKKEIGAGEFENFECVKEVLKNEFLDLNPDIIIISLGLVDDIHIFYLFQDFKNVHLLTDVLYDKIFLLFNEKVEN